MTDQHLWKKYGGDSAGMQDGQTSSEGSVCRYGCKSCNSILRVEGRW